jgi:hypothetical protein
VTEIADQLDLLDLLGGATPAPAEEVQRVADVGGVP